MTAMVAESTQAVRGALPSAIDLPRHLGTVAGHEPGPTLVLTGGLHGNEPAGALAIQNVMRELEARVASLKGRVVGLAGNRTALRRGARFVDRDLNRQWYPAHLARLAEAELTALTNEDREQRELFDALTALERQGPLTLLDLHTTSGKSSPFVCFGDTLKNRELALALPMTAILGLEEVIDGAMLGYYADRGHTAISIEAGQHDDPETVDRHEAAVWLALVAMGSIDAHDAPSLERRQALLERSSDGRPRVVEIRHRHVVRPGDGFAMLPGFASFQPLDAGTLVAHDRGGPIVAPTGGLMLMPRYQGQGEDGYFIAREVAPFWLGVSEALQRLRADALVSRLPGVERVNGSATELRVDPKVARTYLVELMHLVGYRRSRDTDARLAFSRRAR
ncbi:MAG: succinylglutamate desuccinylase/aspartoacylase family protein [Polyangiaceae bacterium]